MSETIFSHRQIEIYRQFVESHSHSDQTLQNWQLLPIVLNLLAIQNPCILGTGWKLRRIGGDVLKSATMLQPLSQLYLLLTVAVGGTSLNLFLNAYSLICLRILQARMFLDLCSTSLYSGLGLLRSLLDYFWLFLWLFGWNSSTSVVPNWRSIISKSPKSPRKRSQF